MNVEYTARQYKITPAIRKEVETGLNKIRKILGDRFETKVILAVEKRRHKAEITINPPNGPIVGLAQADDMVSAVNERARSPAQAGAQIQNEVAEQEAQGGQEV